MKVKIAVVQFKSKQFSPEENLKKTEKFIRKAAKLKADMIVFPEDFISGTVFVRKEFVDFSGKYRKYFQNLARKYRIDVIPGSIIEGDKKGWYNVCYYINSKGEIIASYKKINLWHSERKYLKFGNKVCVFDTKYGRIGLIICWDLAFSEIFREMARKGVEIVICPSCWSYEDAEIGLDYDKNAGLKLVDSLCVARAFENEIVMVFCNSAGKLEDNKFIDNRLGHSQIAVPFKGAVKRLNHNREEMFIQEVDTNILKDAEKVYKIRKDLKKRIF